MKRDPEDSPAPRDPDAHGQQCLIRAWDEAADGYVSYFEPRFRPWIEDAVAALREASPDPGIVVAPGCGAGLELRLLAEALPGHDILGLDPAAGMCRNAARRIHDLPRVTVRRDDGTRTDAWPRPCAGVLSCFVLQLLPHPERALAAWMQALAPGGVLSVVFWPGDLEPEGPFATVRRILEARLAPRNRAWEGTVQDALRAAGGDVLRDETRGHAMRHESAEAFWEAMTLSGPLRPLVLSRGARFVDDVRRAFLRASPSGELVHEPRARLVLARRG
ncbi:class I SAM-dependent methyltransferase [Thioalkalivibrio thiocyanodenitrificans]|uniref:class I SAM-dependent methyltransferase n=1 Tax=Thioalkalivibrio thiocyanodenitrificans TaxID=243063 RepID=UPI0018DD059E|nr:class I SAM-dependent methyltransferase [Thioalkalivibrio thiocyanodenitrificans]